MVYYHIEFDLILTLEKRGSNDWDYQDQWGIRYLSDENVALIVKESVKLGTM